MDEKTKKDMILLFNQGFEEVVLPDILELKDGQEDIKKQLEDVKNRLGTVENRLGTVENRLEVVERKLDRAVDTHIDHSTRLKKLESRVALA